MAYSNCGIVEMIKMENLKNIHNWQTSRNWCDPMNIWTKEVSPTQGKMGRQVCRVLLSLSNVSAHKRQDDEKWSTFCPDPIPFFIPCVAREGKIRERTWMEPKRMNLVGSTSGQYHGRWNFWFSGIFFAELMNGSKLDVMMDQAMHMTIGHTCSWLIHQLNLGSFWQVYASELLSPRRPHTSYGNVVETNTNTSLRENFSFESIW